MNSEPCEVTVHAQKKKEKRKKKKKGKLGTENATFISIQTLTISLCLVILSAKLVNLKQLYLSKQVLQWL